MHYYNIPISLWIGKHGIKDEVNRYTYFKFIHKNKNKGDKCQSFPYMYVLIINYNKRTISLVYNRKNKLKFYDDDFKVKTPKYKLLSDYLDSPYFESFEPLEVKLDV